MNILHITNMYPTQKAPYYGIFIQRQVKSLEKKGVNCKVECIGKNFGGYKRIFKIKEKVDWADLIHCHFGHTGSLTLLWKFFKNKPVVISYCGDDLLGRIEKNGKYSLKSKAFAFMNSMSSASADCAIVLSDKLEKKARSKNKKRVPYGTDAEKFREVTQEEAKRKIGLGEYLGKMVLFLGQEDVPVKNFSLFRKTLDFLGPNFTHRSLGNISDEDMVHLINAADVCVLTSLHEGSPNVIREAMACNRPIVSVDVGDVRSLLDSVEGCFVTGYNPKEIAGAIKRAADFGKVSARKKLLDLGLDLDGTAEKLIKVYEEILEK